MNFRSICLLFVFIVLSGYSHGKWLPFKRNNSPLIEKADALYDKAWNYLGSNSDSAIFFAEQQKTIAQEIEYDLGLVNAYYVIGQAYYRKQYYDVAALNYFKGLDVLKGATEEELLRKKLYLFQCLGAVYYKTYQYDNSIEYYLKALEIAEAENHLQSVGELYFNIGITYTEKKDYKLAEHYLAKSESISMPINDQYNLAKTYNSLGVQYREQKLYDLAGENYQKAIKAAENVAALEKELLMYKINLGENYFSQGKPELAKEIYLTTLAECQESNDEEKIKWIYNNLGDVYQYENNLTQAIVYYKKSISLDDSEAIDEDILYAYKKLSAVYEAMGKYKLALDYKSGYIARADQIIEVKESLAEKNSQYRMKEVEWQRQLTTREIMLARAEKQNFWGRIAIGSAIIFLLVVLRYTFNYYRIIVKARRIVNSF